MGSIELEMSILTGVVGGVLLLLAEIIMLHGRVARYRAHLRSLLQGRRFIRLVAELGGIATVALVQPVVISLLTVTALGSFNPQFSEHAANQLNGVHEEARPLRHDPHQH